MINFADYLAERLEAGGFTTEDALASFLPLLRQVATTHRAGLVAPLQGVNAIQVEANRLWYEESKTLKPALETGRVREKEDVGTRAVEVVQQYRLETQIEQGGESVVSLQIGRRGERPRRPGSKPQPNGSAVRTMNRCDAVARGTTPTVICSSSISGWPSPSKRH